MACLHTPDKSVSIDLISNVIRHFITLGFVDRREVLFMNRSTGLTDLGPPHWPIVLCSALVLIIVFFCIWKGIRSSGKVSVFGKWSRQVERRTCSFRILSQDANFVVICSLFVGCLFVFEFLLKALGRLGRLFMSPWEFSGNKKSKTMAKINDTRQNRGL